MQDFTHLVSNRPGDSVFRLNNIVLLRLAMLGATGATPDGT